MQVDSYNFLLAATKTPKANTRFDSYEFVHSYIRRRTAPGLPDLGADQFDWILNNLNHHQLEYPKFGHFRDGALEFENSR